MDNVNTEYVAVIGTVCISSDTPDVILYVPTVVDIIKNRHMVRLITEHC